MREKIKRLGRTFQKEQSAQRRKREKARMRFARSARQKAFATHGADADGIPPLTKALRRLRAEADARKDIEERERFIDREAAATLAAFPECVPVVPPVPDLTKPWEPSADRSAATCEAEAAWTAYLNENYISKGLPVPLTLCARAPAHSLRREYDEQVMLDALDKATRSQKHRQRKLKFDS